MWPFEKKKKKLGFEFKKKGDITFELTPEEQAEIEDSFKMFEGYYVHPDFAENLQRGVTARALAGYASHQVTLSKLTSESTNREDLLDKAISSIAKAYTFHELPIYLYDFACLLEMRDKMDEAKELFKKFLLAQKNYTPNNIDTICLQDQDINEAISDAIDKSKRKK